MKRMITGLIGIIVTFYVVNHGGWIFGGAVLLLSLIAWHEFCKAFHHINTKLWYSFGMLSVAFVLGCTFIGNPHETVAVLMVTVLIVLGKVVLAHDQFGIEQAAITVMGVFYIALSFAHLILLRFVDQSVNIHTALGDISAGGSFLWIAFIGTWASDTFAFCVGMKFGKHKLCPQISPGKTKEGFVGGIVGTMLTTIGLGFLFSFSLSHMAFLGILIAVVATIGDLAESSFKRLTGIKDSGQILPGHGGVLDRFDSIMFTVPLVYYYIQIFEIY